MAWRIAGTYVASCSCDLICPCPVDAPPNNPDGGTECTGMGVFHIADGNSDNVDLSNVNFAFYNYWPSNLTAGNWKVGVVVDDAASDEQTQALERILSGQEGGTFGELAQLITEFLGIERGTVRFSDGETPTGAVDDKTEIRFEPNRGVDGRPTTVKNAAYGFAPEYRIGTSTGRSDAFGLPFSPSYGEHADFEFSSQAEETVHGRA
jgi:hypothetical protein